MSKVIAIIVLWGRIGPICTGGAEWQQRQNTRK